MSESTERSHGEEVPAGAGGSPGRRESATPGDALRALPVEAEQRGTRFISSQAMQARLFSVYDAAAAAESALSLVQQQLTLTLDRMYYEAGEVEALAAELDALLALAAPEEVAAAGLASDAGPAPAD